MGNPIKDASSGAALRSLALLMAAVCVASCGGGGGDAPAPPPGPSPAPGSPSPGPSPGPSPAPDTQKPVVTLTSPGAFASGLNGTVNIIATATDDVGVASVDVQVDGTDLGAPLVNSPYTTTLDTTQYASGQHVVRARAHDAAGNVSDWVGTTVQFGGSRAQPAGFTRESWISGLSAATSIAQAPDGRFFVTQQTGQLLVVKNGAVVGTPAITLSVDSSVERGLLGVAVHPDFANNHFVYLYFTTAENGTHNRISRYLMNGDTISAGSEMRIADLPTLGAGNHNGGAMHFGADGTLYVGVGDNAVSSNASDTTIPLGKLLRFNDDGTIPSDNPFFAANAGVAKSIWAYGLRNPYTFAVKPGDGTIYINDVGEATWEEIDLGTKAANYGWPLSEGGDNVTSGVTGPLFAYKHSDTNPPGSGPGGFFTGAAIAGGAFYTGTAFPAAYRDSYYFADYGSSFVARFDAANHAAYSFGSVAGSPVDMIAGADGALYVLTRNSIVRFRSP